MSNAAELLIDTLARCGVDTIYGLPGDGINGIMEAIRQRQDKVRFIQVRHEESAAFMATAHAKLTGRLGCCLATSGPGGVHLLNGLYDAKCDGAAVIAITGLPYHDLIDTFTQQDVDQSRLFADVAVYSTRVMSAAHVENVVTLACRTALSKHGVAHLSVPVDVQEEELQEVEASTRNQPHHTSVVAAEGLQLPVLEEVYKAAELLNSASKVAILAGRGALGAREELLRTADLLGAPIIKALLGKAVVPDTHPLTTGGIGLLGTRPSQEAMEECDALLIVGSTFPYIEYYPKPGQARVVQIDSDPARIGLRAPAEVGLVGDAQAVLEMLNAKLRRKQSRDFLQRSQERMNEWRRVLREAAMVDQHPMKPGRAACELSERLADDAIVAWDSGHNTGLCARYIDAVGQQVFFGSGMMASMGCAVPYAIAAALLYPQRQVVAFVGDGGLSMLLGELATIVRYGLSIKIVVIKNNTLGQIKWEQMMFLGNPEYECDLQPIDFAAVAEAMGLKGYRVVLPEDCGYVLDQALSHPGAALVEMNVDPNEPLLPPKRNEKYADNMEKALEQGTPGAQQIRQSLNEQPARSMLQS
ncbi:MAG TPA: thiamine pyrophosphate-dependent enzyme [Steroidobacter sp.]|uniref:thiamine pyrophosphate-dependent enzyme n=1 Tax=Steroidobacter sp. TaxID=1978227 RepID=UPI002EDA2880